ncbi:unnamed protein product [Cyprideis torosa]|uniref:Uncharacterized protein n=1 Tax=Cyprideis torosa TaxID=163714 RepID=A0A7R8ZQ42_9CRUS|nr:unnamed protein product [Cyprideis torosa]CAG0891262.1 unnamed protein product [Cyprideis torosa]
MSLLFRACETHGFLPPELAEGTIQPVPKANKDPSKLGSFSGNIYLLQDVDLDVAKEEIVAHLSGLSTKLEGYFPDLDTSSMQWCQDPFNCDEDLISDDDFPAKEEFIMMRVNEAWKRQFHSTDLQGFRIAKLRDIPTLAGRALQILTTFSTTYRCEQGFSTIVGLKTKKRNRLDIERKRHIGNDIVNIIFLEGPPSEMAEFKANVMRSHFTHIIALVTALEGGGYRLSVHTDESVPLFGPVLPSPPVFHDLRNFRDFLLVKLINGEKAAFNSPIFAEKRTRTLDHLLRSMYDAYHNSEKALPMLSRRALSDVVEAPQRIIRRKEEARRVDFVRIGQAMKLDTIVRGDAPTSLATSSLVRSSPWDAKCIFPDFPFEVQCGDTWEDDGLLLATENGVYSINGESHQLKLVLDKTVQGKQLNVIEQHGIVILRSEKGREGRIYVLPVGLFELDEDAPGLNGTMDTAWSKSDIRDYKIPQSRGCHLYALSKAENPNVKLAVAIGKRLLLYQWKHSAAWSELLTDSEASAYPNGFQCLREFTLSEIPSMVTLIENGPQDQPLICLSVKNSFEILVERSGETYTLFSLEKARLISAQEVCEDEEPEILLSYNHSCHVQKLEPAIGENHKPQLSIQWNSAPETVVAVFPYLLSFGEDTLEVRLIINGNLLASTALPNLKFLTSKTDIVYLTTAPEFVDFQRTTVLMDRPESECSRSASPNSPDPPQKTSPSTQHPPVQQTISSSLGSSNSLPYRIYKIPFTSLAGIQPSLLPQEYLLHGQEWTPRRVSVSVSRSCSSSPLPPTPP